MYCLVYLYTSCVLCFRGMSHSAMTDMQVIEQEQPSSSRSSKFDSYEKKSSKGRSFFDDELDEFSSSSSRYELISEILSCLLSDQVNNLEFEKLLLNCIDILDTELNFLLWDLVYDQVETIWLFYMLIINKMFTKLIFWQI